MQNMVNQIIGIYFMCQFFKCWYIWKGKVKIPVTRITLTDVNISCPFVSVQLHVFFNQSANTFRRILGRGGVGRELNSRSEVYKPDTLTKSSQLSYKQLHKTFQSMTLHILFSCKRMCKVKTTFFCIVFLLKSNIM